MRLIFPGLPVPPPDPTAEQRDHAWWWYIQRVVEANPGVFLPYGTRRRWWHFGKIEHPGTALGHLVVFGMNATFDEVLREQTTKTEVIKHEDLRERIAERERELLRANAELAEQADTPPEPESFEPETDPPGQPEPTPEPTADERTWIYPEQHHIESRARCRVYDRERHSYVYGKLLEMSVVAEDPDPYLVLYRAPNGEMIYEWFNNCQVEDETQTV